jgi:hypothetical protein
MVSLLPQLIFQNIYSPSYHCISVKLSYNACMFQMTQRFDLYAESLAKVAQPDYKPQIIREN